MDLARTLSGSIVHTSGPCSKAADGIGCPLNRAFRIGLRSLPDWSSVGVNDRLDARPRYLSTPCTGPRRWYPETPSGVTRLTIVGLGPAISTS